MLAILTNKTMEIFLDIGASSLIGLFCGLPALWIAKRTGLIDIPRRSAHKLHARPTPLAGGILLTFSLIILVPVFGLMQEPISNVLFAGIIVFLFGLWDDIKGLSAPQKFVGQFIASILLITSDYSVRFLSNMNISFLDPHIKALLDWGITILWFVGITNAFNLIDSMDGLAVGVAGVGFTTFMALALNSQQLALAGFSAILVGVCGGIYIYNRSPARLFLGDAGAQTLGFILAAVAMIYTPLESIPQGSSWFVPIIILGYPIFDTTLVVISRIRHHKPVFSADRHHFYHRLCLLGLTQNKSVLMIHMISLLLGVVGAIALYQPPFWANTILVVTLVVSLLSIVYLEFKIPSGASGEKKSPSI